MPRRQIMEISNVQGTTVAPVGVQIESESKGQHGRSIPGLKNFIAGGFAGICCYTVGHPLDTIKVRLQTAPLPKPGEEPLFRGTFDCLVKTIRNEGFLALFKGLSTPICFATSIAAINFWGVTTGRRMQMSDPHGVPSDFQNITSGMFAGACSSIITCPVERIKCLLQAQQSSGSERKYKDPLNCAKQLYTEKGIRSVYRGLCATLLRDVPFLGAFYFTYEWMLDKFTLKGESREHLNPLRVFIAGGLTGMVCWGSFIPVDVLKSRVQIAPEGTYPRGVRDAFRQLIKEEGVASLYKGAIPVLIRAFPANAGLFLGYEVAMKFFSWISPE